MNKQRILNFMFGAKCPECDSINTRIGISGGRVKCFDCGVSSPVNPVSVTKREKYADMIEMFENINPDDLKYDDEQVE